MKVACLNSRSEIEEQNRQFTLVGFWKVTSGNNESEYATFISMSKMASCKSGSSKVNEINDKERICGMVTTEDIAKDGKPSFSGKWLKKRFNLIA